jgi:hypothetical protein
VTPPKRGRPPIDPTDRSVSLSVRLPSKQYDALVRRAVDARRTVAEQVRAEYRRDFCTEK